MIWQIWYTRETFDMSIGRGLFIFYVNVLEEFMDYVREMIFSVKSSCCHCLWEWRGLSNRIGFIVQRKFIDISRDRGSRRHLSKEGFGFSHLKLLRLTQRIYCESLEEGRLSLIIAAAWVTFQISHNSSS